MALVAAHSRISVGQQYSRWCCPMLAHDDSASWLLSFLILARRCLHMMPLFVSEELCTGCGPSNGFGPSKGTEPCSGYLVGALLLRFLPCILLLVSNCKCGVYTMERKLFVVPLCVENPAVLLQSLFSRLPSVQASAHDPGRSASPFT